MPQIESPSDDGRKYDARIGRIRRVHLAVVAAYLYEFVVLTGFYVAGYVELALVVCYAVCIVTINTSVFVILRSGWNSRAADPSLFLLQQFCSIAIALALALAAPQIAIQPFGTWIATSFFGFMAPRRGLLNITLGASVAAMATALAIGGSHFGMPTSTLAGRVLTWAVLLGVLARGIGVANFIAGLRRRLREQNDALRSALARIEDLAQRDELTGLANRRSILQWLGDQAAQCDRSGLPLTVALLDIDHFKRINDEFGHLVGDLVLEMFSKCGLAMVRATDRFGRYGGEEFLVVLVATPLQAAREPLERIRAGIASCDWSGVDRPLKVTVTIGAAAYRRGETLKDLMERADLALYRGKQGGRNRVILEDQPYDGDLFVRRPLGESAFGEDARRHAAAGRSETAEPVRPAKRRPEYWTDESAMLM
jgi:diguanylate cyclase (GGDEF)-like protein